MTSLFLASGVQAEPGVDHSTALGRQLANRALVIAFLVSPEPAPRFAVGQIGLSWIAAGSPDAFLRRVYAAPVSRASRAHQVDDSPA